MPSRRAQADPEGFDLNNCATQRNLDGAGREQARSIGEGLEDYDVEIDRIYTSQWCRCVETGELLDLAEVETLATLNSTWLKDKHYKLSQRRGWVLALSLAEGEQTFLFLTHYANIMDLTGEALSSGELMVISFVDHQLKVLGRIRPEDLAL